MNPLLFLVLIIVLIALIGDIWRARVQARRTRTFGEVHLPLDAANAREHWSNRHR